MRKILSLACLIPMAGLPVQAQRANTLTACEAQRGFSLLFDGTRESFASHFVEFLKDDSTTETPLKSTWKLDASDSALHSGHSQPSLRSRLKYADFDFRMEYRNDGEAGIIYHALLTRFTLEETAAMFSIQDNPGIANRKTMAGSLYDMFAPSPENYRPYSGEKWNEARIVSVGDSVEHWLNGERVLAFRFHSNAWWAAFYGSKWSAYPGYCMRIPGDRNSGPIREGYLGIQANQGGKWSIRNLRVSRRASFYDEKQSCPDTSGAVATTPVPVSPDRPPFAGSLRRSSSGVSFALAGSRIFSARLISADGHRSVSARTPGSQGEAFFAGSFPRGLYFVELRTASGFSYRKLSLL